MSIISSRSSSIASILKGPGMRTKLVGQPNRVNFKLPKNLKIILGNYETGCDRRVYEDLICILRDAHIKDSELIELIVEIRQNISLLGPPHKLLIEILLQINWTNRCSEAIVAYKSFLEDLICVHIYHCKLVMDKLVSQLKPSSDDTREWENGIPREEDLAKLYHIHDVLFKFLKIVPMSSTFLIQCLTSQYPYFKANTHVHEVYLHSLLQILDYAPQLRPQILTLIIDRMEVLDVNVPRPKIGDNDDEMENDEGGDVFEIDEINETDNKNTNDLLDDPILHTLDVCMKKLLKYIHDTCYPEDKLNMENVRALYLELLPIFETVILPTYASYNVQFIMFYICSFKITVTEAFVNWLWHKVSNPNVALIIRQSAVAYIASFLARAKFVPIGELRRMIQEMSNWIHSYIAAQDGLECANSDVRVHTIFYAVCQAMFYVVSFRHNDLVVDMKKDCHFLQSLNFNKIVTCRLNPLKFCIDHVVQQFATVTRAYQLAYCYTVIEHNSRSNLPVIQNSNRFITKLDPFFPFDPFILPQSHSVIDPLYIEYDHSKKEDSVSLSSREENDEDDFMDISCSQPNDNNHLDKFSYSTSPGFIH